MAVRAAYDARCRWADLRTSFPSLPLGRLTARSVWSRGVPPQELLFGLEDSVIKYLDGMGVSGDRRHVTSARHLPTPEFIKL
jgi:hypothetical protein